MCAYKQNLLADAVVILLSDVERTFAKDLLAHTGCPPVLDSPVTTVDVEETVLDKPEATSERQRAYDTGRDPGRTGHAAAEAAATAGLLDLVLYPAEVVLHGVLVRHPDGM